MDKKKIPQGKGKKVSAETRKKGMAAMGKAMSTRVQSTSAHKQMTARKAKHL
jgi:hypothetical protein